MIIFTFSIPCILTKPIRISLVSLKYESEYFNSSRAETYCD